MKKPTKLMLLAIVVMTMMAGQSCKKSPTVDFFFSVDVYTVTFTSQASNTDTYEWDFGDGNSSTEANPVHTYASVGEYDVTLTVQGEGGSASVAKTVATATFEEMLTGGSSKTWVLKQTYTAGKDGAGPTSPDLELTIPTISNVLTAFGLGVEYDNEYTFFADGSYQVDSKNDSVLAAILWGVVTYGQENIVMSTDYSSLPLCKAPYTEPNNAMWSIETDDLTVDCATEDPTNPDVITEETLTWSGKNRLEFTNGGFIGYQDFRGEVFIKELTPDVMHCAIFLVPNEAYIPKPSMFVHITFIPKQ